MRNNLIGSTGNTVHLPVNTVGQNRYACRPNSFLADAFVEYSRTDSPVTCGSCLRVIARAHALADAMVDSMDAGITEAEEHVAGDIKQGRVDMWAAAPSLRQSVRAGVGSVRYWFNRGDIRAVGTAAYALRRRELELAHLEQLAAGAAEPQTHTEWEQRAQADRAERVGDTLRTIADMAPESLPSERWAAMLGLEHGYALELARADGVHVVTAAELAERQRRLERVAQGRTEAQQGRQDGQRPPYPVDDRDWLRCSLSTLSVAERIAEHREKIAQGLAQPGRMSDMDLWVMGMAGFDVQRNLDIIHARVIGQCPGCYREGYAGEWGHRAICPMYLMPGDSLDWDTEDTTDISAYWSRHSHGWTAEEVEQYWATADPNR